MLWTSQQFATHLSVAPADVIDVHGARRVSRDLRAKPISLLAAIREVELAKLVVGAIRLRRTGEVGEEVGRHRDAAAEFGLASSLMVVSAAAAAKAELRATARRASFMVEA